MKILNEGKYQTAEAWTDGFVCPICKLDAEIDINDLNAAYIRDELHGRDNSFWKIYCTCPNMDCRYEIEFERTDLPVVVTKKVIERYRVDR